MMEEPFFVEINLPTAFGRFSESAVTSFVINNSSLNRHLLEYATAEVLGNVTELSTRSVASDLLST